MIGAQIGVWAGFGERHRSRRRRVDHDLLDPLRAVALGSRVQSDHDQSQSAITGPAGDRRHQPARQYWQQGQRRASPQWLLRYCQGATLSAVPRMAKTAPNEAGSNRAAPCRDRHCIVIGRRLCTARQPISGRIREQRRQPLWGNANPQEIKPAFSRNPTG
jgi:hypothetical protein